MISKIILSIQQARLMFYLEIYYFQIFFLKFTVAYFLHENNFDHWAH